MSKSTITGLRFLPGLLFIPAFASAEIISPGSFMNSLREVQQYNFAIHILAMLLVGFGFLMVEEFIRTEK